MCAWVTSCRRVWVTQHEQSHGKRHTVRASVAFQLPFFPPSPRLCLFFWGLSPLSLYQVASSPRFQSVWRVLPYPEEPLVQ